MEFYFIFLFILVSTYALDVRDTPAVGANNAGQNDNRENIKWRQSVCVIYEQVLASMINRPSKLNREPVQFNREDNRSQGTENDQSPVRLISPMVFESLSVRRHAWTNPGDSENLRNHTLVLKNLNIFGPKSNALFWGKREGQNLVITPATSWYREFKKEPTKIVDSPVIVTLFTDVRYLGDEYPICTNYEEIKTGASQGNITIYKARSAHDKRSLFTLPLLSRVSPVNYETRQWTPAFKMFRKREADAKFDGERGDAMRNSAFMVNVAEKQELHDISYKSNNNFSNRPTLDTVKSIQSEENFGAQTAPAPSAQGLDEKNFQVTSGLFQKFFPNSSPQLLKIDYQGPVIFKLGVASKGPQQTSSPPGENQLSPVFDYFLKYRETKPYGEQHNVIKCPVSGAQSSTTDSSSEVGGCYTKPEAPISSGIVQAPTGVQSAEANTEKSETPSTAATEVPEVQSTAAKEDGPSTENTGITNEPSTETTGISVEDPSSEATVPPEAPSTEATEVLKTPSTEATEIPIEDLSTEATGPLEGQSTEATQIPEDPSTEATEISEDLSTVASETPEDQSTEATEISEGPSTEVTAVPVSLSLEVFQTPEDSSTEATEIPEESSTEATEVPEDPPTETLSADETWTTAAALSGIEPSPTEATDVTEPNEQFTTEDQQGINLTDEVLFTDVKDKNNSPVSEETEEVFDTRSANDTKKSQLEFETISSNDNVEVESNAEVPQPELLESLPDTDPRQASKAIADAINAYEADGSPNAVERLQDILEATVNITGDVEDPDEAALDTDEDAEDDV